MNTATRTKAHTHTTMFQLHGAGEIAPPRTLQSGRIFATRLGEPCFLVPQAVNGLRGLLKSHGLHQTSSFRSKGSHPDGWLGVRQASSLRSYDVTSSPSPSPMKTQLSFGGFERDLFGFFFRLCEAPSSGASRSAAESVAFLHELAAWRA